jgi:hypothetical protein
MLTRSVWPVNRPIAASHVMNPSKALNTKYLNDQLDKIIAYTYHEPPWL